MSEVSIWYQLYVGDTKSGGRDCIEINTGGQIVDFRDAVYERARNMVGQHCDSAALAVYPPGTSIDELNETNKLKLSSSPPSDTTCDDPLIVVAPVKPQQQQEYAEIIKRIEKKIVDIMGITTISVDMSKATQDFTIAFLRDAGISVSILPVCTEAIVPQLEPYRWGEKESEIEGQPGCIKILKEELLPWEIDGRELGLFDVRDMKLPEVHAGRHESYGFSDIALGDKVSMSLDSVRDLRFSYTIALVELKTGKDDLIQGELLLQLVSLSMISNMKRGVVVLGTDCAAKWRLLYFSNKNKIAMRPYVYGKKCLQDFRRLVENSEARCEKFAASARKANRAIQGPEDHEENIASPSGA